MANSTARDTTPVPAESSSGQRVWPEADLEQLRALIELCVSLETEAAHWYTERAEEADDEEQQAFWHRLAADEREHNVYWEKLLGIADEGGLSIGEEERQHFHTYLEENARSIRTALREARSAPDIETALVVACRMESHMLQPAVVQLLQLVNPLMSCDVIGDYREHITALLGAVERFCPTPAMRLVADFMRRTWQDHMQLSRETQVDILTGALNKRGLRQALLPLAHLAHREKRRVAMLMIDLDHFKQVNDTYGHHVGDRALAFVGRMLHDSLRRSDVVGRYGGEEFLVFLFDVTEDQTAEVAEKIRARIHAGSVAETGVLLTVSVGAAEGVFDGEVAASIEQFTRAADAAMYRAKELGRDHVCSCPVV